MMSKSRRSPALIEIQKAVTDAINRLLAEDGYLLINKVNERAITHKLGEYLQQSLITYNIDCEYNRMIDSHGNIAPKTINIDELWLAMKNTSESNFDISLNNYDGEPIPDARGRVAYYLQYYNGEKRILSIFPDIICHTRGTMRNKFVIEAKKSNNKDHAARNFDIVKLLAMTTQLGYEFGFYLNLPVENDYYNLKSFKISFKEIEKQVYEIKIGK